MNIPALLADAVTLIGRIPAPLQNAAIDVAKVLWDSLAGNDSPEETARKALEELAKLKHIQSVYHARASAKFPGYRE